MNKKIALLGLLGSVALLNAGGDGDIPPALPKAAPKTSDWKNGGVDSPCGSGSRASAVPAAMLAAPPKTNTDPLTDGMLHQV